jgi:outer membrane assembly lipoprotein YfiO
VTLRTLLLVTICLELCSCATLSSINPLNLWASENKAVSELDSATVESKENQKEEEEEKEEESEPEELKKKTDLEEDESDYGSTASRETRILDQAEHYFEEGLFTLAREKFQYLRSIDLNAAYTEYIDLKLADCSMYTADYPSASKEYLAFVDTHPRSESVPYALYVAGQALQSSTPGAGRDPSSLYRAEEIYERLIKEHPESVYSRAALKHFVEAEDQLKEHRKSIIGFYENQDLGTALRARMDNSLLEEKATTAKVEAMRKLVDGKAPLLHNLGKD